jgi:hypothetical protein
MLALAKLRGRMLREVITELAHIEDLMLIVVEIGWDNVQRDSILTHEVA